MRWCCCMIFWATTCFWRLRFYDHHSARHAAVEHSPAAFDDENPGNSAANSSHPKEIQRQPAENAGRICQNWLQPGRHANRLFTYDHSDAHSFGMFQVFRIMLGTTPQALFELTQRVYAGIDLSQILPINNQFFIWNLGQPDAFLILPILVFVTMFVQQSMPRQLPRRKAIKTRRGKRILRPR